jgi:tetratricopeptide (TPR) repeat protein
MKPSRWWCVALLVLACGSRDDKKKEGDPSAPKSVAEQPAAGPEIALLPVGVTKPADFNYSSGKAEKAYRPVAEAYKRKDWTAVKSAAEETVQLDKNHLDAHRMLASALAQQGEFEKALEHLSIALAADWIRWGAKVEIDPDLEPLLSSPLGARLKEMNAGYKQELVRRAKAGLLVVARRGAFKPPGGDPKKKGAARMASRAELFAYDKESGRWLRLTQTGFQVVGFLPSPTGDEIAYVTIREVSLPGDPKAAPPVLAAARIGTLSLAAPEAPVAEAEVKGARTLALEYLAGDELVATAYQPQGYWGLGTATSFSVDKAAGKTKASKPPPAGGRRLLVRFEGVELETPGDTEGIAADWNPETGTAEEFVLDASKKRVQLPKGEAARRASIAWSPDRKKVAFATQADACSDQPADRAAALYLVDVESGKLKHVAKGQAAFAPRFLDAATLAHADEEGGVRLYDAIAGRENGKLTTRGGLGLVGVGSQSGLLCTRESAPPPETTVTPAPPGDGSEGEEPVIMEGE